MREPSCKIVESRTMLSQDAVGALRGRATLSAGCIAAVLASDAGGSVAPLLELAALDVTAEAARGVAGSELGAGRTAVHASATLAANVYSADCGSWEPAVEPWQAAVSVGFSPPGCAATHASFT